MNPNEASANKTYNITTNGVVFIPVPANPTGKLVLQALVINTKGASSNTVTIYDSNLTLGANVELRKGTIDTTVVPGRFEYNIPMFKGIYIVVATGTAPDITVIYSETP